MGFEVKNHGPLIDKNFRQLDFLGIPGFPNEVYDVYFNYTQSFQGYDDLDILHIASFIKVVVDFNIINEYDLMRVFVCILEEHAL